MPYVEVTIDYHGVGEVELFKSTDGFGIYEYARCYGYTFDEAMGLVNFASHARVGDAYKIGGLYARVGDD